jgi:hypothetical protein
MAGLDASVIGNLQPPKSMSLSDMLGIAKGGYELSKMKELYPAVIAKEQAASQGAQALASQEQLKNLMAHHSYIVQNIQDEMNNPNISADSIIKRATEINANSPNGGDPKALAQTLMGMPDPKTATKTDYQAFLAGQLGKTLSSQAQLEKLYPATVQQDIGGQSVNIATGNPLISALPPGTPTGPYIQKNLAPQVAVSPTGGPMQFGGGGSPQMGNVNNQPSSVSVAPAGGAEVSGIQNKTQTTNPSGVTSKQMSQPKVASGPIPYMQGETYDAYRERVGKVQQSVGQAKEDIDPSKSNSVTNAKYTNEQILKALDDKNVRVGPLMQAIAEKSEGLNLTSDEQYVKKLLEQRIQQQSSRSNEDQASKAIASGNFGNSKDAIRSVLFKDNGTLTAQELKARGTLSRAGDINKPNLAGVNQFQNDFAKNADPQVTHLMGVIGNKPLSALTKTEIGHLQKEFSGMSKEDFNALMKKRQALIDLAGK